MPEAAPTAAGCQSLRLANGEGQILPEAPKPAGRRGLKVGQCYLTPTGVAAQLVGKVDGYLMLRSLATDTRFTLPAACPLKPADGEGVDARFRPPSPSPSEPQARSRREQPLAPLIDAMLLAGNMTMRGIVREIQRKASAACHGRDLRANVRARLYWFRRKGRMAARDVQGRICVR